MIDNEPLTEQIVFDTVVEHFKAQEVPAIEGSQCKYRGPNGLRCAVGVLISDDEYTPKMDDTGAVPALVEAGLLPDRLLPFATNGDGEYNDVLCGESLLGQLQITHDREKESLLTRDAAITLRDIAETFNLDASKVDWA